MARKERERLDCSWCSSVASIEFGICQVCLMEYPIETTIIAMPRVSQRKKDRVITLPSAIEAAAD